MATGPYHKWLGNSEQVARKHYLQVTDDHYAKALLIAMSEVGGTECGTAGSRTDSQNSSIE